MMQDLDSVAFYITVITGGLLSLKTIGQLMAQPLNRNRVIGAILFSCISVQILSLGIGPQRLPDFALYAYGLHVPMYFLIGPLVRSYAGGLLSALPAVEPSDQDPSREPKLPGYLQWTPFILATAIHVPFFFLSPELKLAFLENRVADPHLAIYSEVLRWVTVLGLLSVGYFSIRLILEFRVLEMIQHADTPILRNGRILFLWLALMIPLGVAAQLLTNPAMKRAVIALVSLAILWVYLLEHRYPRFFHQMDQQIRARAGKSRIRTLNTATTVERLEQVMREERLFLDEDLNRERLGAVIGLHADQLSELLNQVMGVDFYEYIRQHRVEAAKRMLVEEPERTVLSIAHAVGFNSKASFNRNFKAIVGRTPVEYRRNQQAG